MDRRPSVAFGFARAGGLWKLVLAVWLVSVAVHLPARAVVWFAVVGTLASLPEGPLPEGEALLIVSELLSPVLAPLAIAVLSGWFVFWAWTVLWHAGVVRWFVLSGRLDVRLSEILTRGLLDWWRWARLGLTSATALVLIGAPIWSMTAILLGRANSSGHEGLGVVILALAVALTPLMVALAWSATLSGSWLLGVGDRRSAVLSWIAGLRESLRRPVASAATLAAWAVPGMASMALPLVLGAELELIRVGVLATIVEIVTGVAGAFCWVGLFLSFAPVTGLASTEKPVNEASDPKTR